MLNRRNRERGERAEPLSKMAVIYVREPFPGEENYYGPVPTADEQRVLCRLEARDVGAEVIGEFTDEWFFAPEWSGLTDVVRLVKHERPLFVIVSSWDRLAGDYRGFFTLASVSRRRARSCSTSKDEAHSRGKVTRRPAKKPCRRRPPR